MGVSLTLAALLSTAAIAAQADSLLVNGDFEAGNTGFTSALRYDAGNGANPATYDVDTDPKVWFGNFASYGDHTTGTGNMMMVNGSQTVEDVVWSQTVAVQASTDYDFGGWISAMFPGASALALQIAAATIGTITGPSISSIWQEFGFGWNSGGSTSAVISLLQASNGFGGNDYALDDLSFVGPDAPPPAAVIPLPAAGWRLLASLGGLAAARRRA